MMKAHLPEKSSLSKLLRLSQRAASGHLNALGLEGEVEKQGMVWVIIRTGGEIFAPLQGDITVTTWPGKSKSGMMPRYCEMHNADGTLALRLVSVWMLADAKNRQMRLDAKIALPDLSRGDELPFPRHLPKKDLPALGSFTVTQDMIDANGHMNNAAYPDAALAFADKSAELPKTFCLDYRNEILPQTTVLVGGAWQENLLLLGGRSEDKEYFRMQFTY